MVKNRPVSTFSSTTEERDGVVVLHMQGDAALEHVDELEAAVTRMVARSPARLIVDLTEVTFIASLGVGQLVTLCGHVKRKGGRAAVVAPPGPTRQVLDRCKLNTVVPLTDTIEDARATIAE